MRYILGIDQGTTGSTAMILDEAMAVRAKVGVEFPQYYPRPGWVEHDPEEIWRSVGAAVAAVLRKAGIEGRDLAGIGITNQRETTILWDRATGEPVYRAIVWQCRRTAAICAGMAKAGHGSLVRARTGLVLDPYFSGTKIQWILDEVEGVRERAEQGRIAFGTVDTFLAWRLTGGAAHVTDPSNASRTLMFDIRTGGWDPELLDLLRVPAGILPAVHPSSHVYGTTEGAGFLPDGIPVAGILGDQQAALFGQACFDPGDAKCTYGTGAFLLVNTGEQAADGGEGLLTTVAWNLGGRTTYAIEGSCFIAGAAVQWLRDALGVIGTSGEVEGLAAQADPQSEVVFVPALAGLGAPYWDPAARGAVMGLTRGSGRAELAKAVLEGIALQVRDLAVAMERNADVSLGKLRVDGGASADDMLMQLQSDLVGMDVVRPAVIETTGLGAMLVAGLAVGVFEDQASIRSIWREDRTFHPGMDAGARAALIGRWERALRAVRLMVSG